MSDSESVVYKNVKLQVSNATAGQNIAVVLTSNGVDIGWSTGPSFQNSAGIKVAALSGELPLTQFGINPSEVSFQTQSSGGGGSLTFQVSAYMVAKEGIGTFYLRSSSDPGVEVTAQIGDSVPQVVNTSQTLFSWNPI